jgi:hypothetical protein
MRKLPFARAFIIDAISFFAIIPVAKATLVEFQLEDVLINNNPVYTITGSFTYDTSFDPHSTCCGYSNFHVNAITPSGSFQMNNV